MRRLLLLLLLLPLGPLAAQRPRPAYDPETREGLLIEHIEQETDPAQKLRYMEEFASQYPKHPAIAWVYDQLQPVYFQNKAWEQTVRIGALRLAIEPGNLEAGELALRAAEALHDTAQIVDWADRVWPVATAAAQKGGPNATTAAQTAAYAEFLVYSAAEAAADPKARLDLLQNLEQHMPASKYVPGLTREYFEIYRQLGDEQKAASLAEKGLQTDPGNPEMLLLLAELHARVDNSHERQLVIAYTARALESLDRASRPAAMNEADWQRKKAAMVAQASYFGGIANSLSRNYGRADALLRVAVGTMRENDERSAAAYYHLGIANYQLAEAGHDRSRPVDALKFLRRCAAIKSPYQEQALKFIDGIRAEYSLP